MITAHLSSPLFTVGYVKTLLVGSHQQRRDIRVYVQYTLSTDENAREME